MSSTPQFNGEQLGIARSQRWHQAGDALLTLEAAREWVGELGLVLFAPRANQLAAPAPSLVEATLGRATSAPTAAEAETARSLVGRMVAEGAALPLNLLGGPGDVPDFVVSTQVFSYVFTLRGDKAWKQPVATSGSLKVSLLAAKVYETLAEGDARTAPELASELGREVTEAAIVRALVELWAQLRVIPLLQQDGSATMWELTSRRFTKQIKAGANAGQPTALSALISLYLAQVYAATEEEVETFLSPLAARSRVRDVLHGLTGARQLEEAVLEGKTLLSVPGSLPEFPEIAAPESAKQETALQGSAAASEAPRERIRRFDRPRAPREERRDRPFRGDRERPAKPFGEKRQSGGRPAGKSFGQRERPARPFEDKRRGARAEGRGLGERERRPFQKDGANGERPGFVRPWNEERKPRPRGAEGERPSREKTYRKDNARDSGAKKEFRGGSRKPDTDRGPRQERVFRPRREGEREGFAPRAPKPYVGREEGRREKGGRQAGEKRPFRRPEGGDRARATSDRARPTGDRKTGGRPAGKSAFGGQGKFGDKRKFEAKPGFGERPKFGRKPPSGERPKFGGKPSGDRPRSGGPSKFGGKSSFGGGSKFGGKPKFGNKPKPGRKPAKGAPRSGEDKPRREAEE